jgi:hypothetical protein
MIYPFIVLFYFLIIQYFSNNYKLVRNSNSNIFVVLVVFTSLIILEILRLYSQSIFGDVANYKSIFEEIDSILHVVRHGYGLEYYYSNVEIGFSLLISVFKIFSNNYDFFLFFVSVIELSVFYFFCRKFKINLVNVMPIYIALIFITFEIGMLRQALGFSFFLIGLMNINKKIIYVIFIALGSTFHISTIFCISLIWVDRFVNRKFYYFIFLLSLCIYILQIDLISSLFIYFESINFANFGRIFHYMDVDRPNNYLGIGFWERIIFLILMNLVYVDLWRKNKINKYNNLIFNLGISSILLQLIFFSDPTITSRLRYFIVIFPAIFLSQYIYVEYTKGLTWIYQSLFSVYLLMYLFTLSTYLK